jgi:uncharacterized membrane protein
MKRILYKQSKQIVYVVRLVIAVVVVIVGYQLYNYFHANFYTPDHETAYLYIRPGKSITKKTYGEKYPLVH